MPASSRQLPEAVLLDLDDTILNDSEHVEDCWKGACLAQQRELGSVDAHHVFDAIEKTRAWFWSDPDRHRLGRLDMAVAREQIVRRALADVGVDHPTLAATIAKAYGDRRDELLALYPGAIDTIQWLRGRGCRLALVTNGSSVLQRAKVERFGLANLFDAILIEGEIGFGKPNPKVYELALSHLEARASDVWMIGDNLEFDVAAPQRLGIFGIWMDVRGAGLPDGCVVKPDRIVRALAELRTPTGSS